MAYIHSFLCLFTGNFIILDEEGFTNNPGDDVSQQSNQSDIKSHSRFSEKITGVKNAHCELQLTRKQSKIKADHTKYLQQLNEEKNKIKSEYHSMQTDKKLWENEAKRKKKVGFAQTPDQDQTGKSKHKELVPCYMAKKNNFRPRALSNPDIVTPAVAQARDTMAKNLIKKKAEKEKMKWEERLRRKKYGKDTPQYHFPISELKSKMEENLKNSKHSGKDIDDTIEEEQEPPIVPPAALGRKKSLYMYGKIIRTCVSLGLGEKTGNPPAPPPPLAADVQQRNATFTMQYGDGNAMQRVSNDHGYSNAQPRAKLRSIHEVVNAVRFPALHLDAEVGPSSQVCKVPPGEYPAHHSTEMHHQSNSRVDAIHDHYSNNHLGDKSPVDTTSTKIVPLINHNSLSNYHHSDKTQARMNRLQKRAIIQDTPINSKSTQGGLIVTISDLKGNTQAVTKSKTQLHSNSNVRPQSQPAPRVSRTPVLKRRPITRESVRQEQVVIKDRLDSFFLSIDKMKAGAATPSNKMQELTLTPNSDQPKTDDDAGSDAISQPKAEKKTSAKERWAMLCNHVVNNDNDNADNDDGAPSPTPSLAPTLTPSLTPAPHDRQRRHSSVSLLSDSSSSVLSGFGGARAKRRGSIGIPTHALERSNRNSATYKLAKLVEDLMANKNRYELMQLEEAKSKLSEEQALNVDGATS